MYFSAVHRVSISTTMLCLTRRANSMEGVRIDSNLRLQMILHQLDGQGNSPKATLRKCTKWTHKDMITCTTGPIG